jgi:prepilin-type N-terminal cleavage/methylation domain-containing protein
MNYSSNKKGFTLIELLIVIAILAVLSVAVILTLNPAELLRQARDATRVSDLANLDNAISLYLADVQTPSLATGTAPAPVGYGGCYVSSLPATSTANCGTFSGEQGGPNVSPYNYTIVGSSSRAVDSTGWLPIRFTAISSGAPFGNLPVDPVNNTGYYYAYAATTSLQYEVNATMESTKYGTGPTGVGASDNGDASSSAVYEKGTNLRL